MAAKDTGETAGDYEVFYDSQGREFRAYTAVDRANARHGWGYSTEKPKTTEDEPTAPVGDPGPTSGAVTP
jgi:hypothetical protein